MDDTAASTLFAWLNREVWLVTASAEGRRGGLIATFVSEASIVSDLPRVLVGLAKQHHTRGLIELSRAFALHLLSEDNLDLVWRFGLQSGRTIDKFAGLSVKAATGSPLLAGRSAGWSAESRRAWTSATAPCTWRRWCRAVRPTSPHR